MRRILLAAIAFIALLYLLAQTAPRPVPDPPIPYTAGPRR